MSDLTVTPNGVYKLKCVATDAGGDEIQPRVSDWILTGNTDSRTSVDNEGVLKIGPAEAGTLAITVEGAGELGTFQVEVDPAGAPYWPAPVEGPPTFAVTMKQAGSVVTTLAPTVRTSVFLAASDGSDLPACTVVITGSENTTWTDDVDQSTGKIGYFTPDALAAGTTLTLLITPGDYDTIAVAAPVSE